MIVGGVVWGQFFVFSVCVCVCIFGGVEVWCYLSIQETYGYKGVCEGGTPSEGGE